MSDTKHTPGPWAVHTPKPGQYHENARSVIAPRATSDETVLICELNTSVRNPWLPPADTDADARLIAAAPELLAACERLVREFTTAGTGAGLQEAVTLAQRAVAKAVGL